MPFRKTNPLWTIAAAAAALPLSTASAGAAPLVDVHDVQGVDLGPAEDGIARDVARDLAKDVARDLARDAAKDLGRDREPIRRTIDEITDRL
ncbi:hypothetical protein OOZ19_21125 [Saccharopolyspora sp. NFXS83]|uniref:hypothetical protein n=1 Tax=Saccharopolyspora sp. NFXS83 TaxID=2993560 RepID=UPI00224B5D74|nr:hypothetical protein [Saccharopolyspora sp. NFXS83]MCX2732748.1 hypothetical protein [Saccharopolyspora sp. NFXS83]